MLASRDLLGKEGFIGPRLVPCGRSREEEFVAHFFYGRAETETVEEGGMAKTSQQREEQSLKKLKW
jgi:hypothetical protein